MLTRGSAADYEVFLVERNPQLRFMGGFHAFPGGTLDAGERDLDAGRADESLRGFLRCAVRELFEETGIVLPALQESLPIEDRDHWRTRLLDREDEGASEEWNERFGELSEEASHVRLCRFLTPPFVLGRYETEFFQIEIPAGQSPQIIEGELVGGAFYKPKDALAAWRRGELRIVPPVLRLFELFEDRELGDCGRLAQEEAASYRSGALHHIRFVPGIYMEPLETPTIPPATTTNCYVVGQEQLYVIDPAAPKRSEQDRLIAFLDDRVSEGRKLAAVLVTHHHPDHVGAVQRIAEHFGLPIHAHPRTLERLPEQPRDPRPLEDGMSLPLGTAPDGQAGWELTAYHTPGHDQGHLAFVESRYRACIAGDLCSLLSTIVIDPPEGHLRTYLDSLERMAEMDLGAVFAAHGPPSMDGKALLRRFLAHRAMREEKLVDALGELRSAPELLERVYNDVDPSVHALASRSLQAGLDKLEEEGRVRKDGDGYVLVST